MKDIDPQTLAFFNGLPPTIENERLVVAAFHLGDATATDERERSPSTDGSETEDTTVSTTMEALNLICGLPPTAACVGATMARCEVSNGPTPAMFSAANVIDEVRVSMNRFHVPASIAASFMALQARRPAAAGKAAVVGAGKKPVIPKELLGI